MQRLATFLACASAFCKKRPCFHHSGYSAISIREIAQSCGITKAGLYYHFKDKEALIIAIMTTTWVKLAAWSETAGYVAQRSGTPDRIHPGGFCPAGRKKGYHSPGKPGDAQSFAAGSYRF